MHVKDVTDWYIPDKNPSLSVVYLLGSTATATRIPQEWYETAEKLAELAREASIGQHYFRIHFEGMTFRGVWQRTVGGSMCILRRIPDAAPDFKNLGLPGEVRALLADPAFGSGGGLILVCGNPGHGKSTTCAALVKERVINTGGFCLAVEDPPEFPLHGDYPAANGRVGKIIQVQVENGAYAEHLAEAMRCYPSNVQGSMLLVGEVLDAKIARQVLIAAVHGQLVISTMHAGDIIGALERLLGMAKETGMGAETANSLLAHSLRAAVHQNLDGGKLSVKALFSSGSSSAAAARVKAGHLQQLSTELEMQATYLRNNQLVSKILERGGRNG